jgi:hypothetical protein
VVQGFRDRLWNLFKFWKWVIDDYSWFYKPVTSL